MSSTKFVFFGPIRKTRWLPCSLIGWDIFEFSSWTAEQNSTKLDRKQYLNVLYQVCVFWADRINKMAALASDWLRHFRLLLWNCWTELNETWQEARSQSPLSSLQGFLYQEIEFLASRHRILDIKKLNSWYQEIFIISWYQEIEFFISSVVIFGSIPKSNFWRVFDVFLDLVILPYFTAISMDFMQWSV